MTSLHVTASGVVILNPFRHDVVQVPLAKKDESKQALVFYGLHEPFDPAIQIGRGNGKYVCSHVFGFQCGGEFFGDQRDQLFDCLAQRLPQLDQSGPLVGLRVNLTRNPRPEDLVLLLQKFDVLREFVAARRRDQRQQWVEDFGGRAIAATRY